MARKGKTDVFCDCQAEQGWHPLVAEIPVLVRLPGHPKALMALLVPRTRSLVAKTHEPVTFCLFLFVLRIPSTAWALYQDILLGISNLGPILSLQPDLKFYFIFLRQRIQRDGTKLSPCSLLILQPHQSILPLHLLHGSNGCTKHGFVMPPGPTQPNTLQYFWKPREYRLRH